MRTCMHDAVSEIVNVNERKKERKKVVVVDELEFIIQNQHRTEEGFGDPLLLLEC